MACLVHVASVFVATAHQVSCSSFIGFGGAAQFEFAGIGLLGQFSGSFLSFVQVVVHSLDAAVCICVFPSFAGVQVACSFDFILVAGTLFLQLGQFVTGVVDFFAECVATV